jgi:pimeloyl-ACP methyl ester carboxylesterase
MQQQNNAVAGIEQWWRDGDLVTVSLDGADREIFVRRCGSGPNMTLLHGFPSSCYDWAKIIPGLAEHYSLLVFDFLGFGASEKPSDHEYSIHEQADLVEALWEQFGTTECRLVAHDYGATVAQELMARAQDGLLGVGFSSVTLLNGGVYPELHRAEPVQRALRDPVQGPLVSARMNGELFAAAISPTFGPTFDQHDDVAPMWRSITNRDGQYLSHRLIHYLTDRERFRDRWVNAMEQNQPAVGFVWGLNDPVAGAHIAAHIAARLPRARLRRLPDVGHWPALEAPHDVLGALLEP